MTTAIGTQTQKLVLSVKLEVDDCEVCD